MFAWSLAGASAQESVGTTVLEPCRESCGLTLVPEGEFGEDSGPGMIEGTLVRSWKDASGRLYLAGESVAHVQVFGPDGAFLRRIGRRGEGPGELQHVSSLAVTADGIFSVLDRQRASILTFDWTGALKSEVRTRGWMPWGIETVHLSGALAVHHADIPTPDLVGYPLHLVDLETGEIKRSFGSLSGEYPVGATLDHVIARGPGRSVWMARADAYEIELWDQDRLLRSFRRDADWFPEVPLADRAHGWEGKPAPATSGLAADSLLWVLVLTPDDRWEEGAEARDYDLFLDNMLEVIDWRNGRVVADAWLDEEGYHWVQPGLLGLLVITPTGSVRYRTYRVQLDEG